MTAYGTGPETGIKYTLESAEGYEAVFNDPTDPFYVGSLTRVTGLDSPEVRENTAELVEADGGVHGNFWYGRRPVIVEGQIRGDDATERNERLTRLRRASDAMREDAELTFTPSGSIEQFIAVRRQQPLRLDGGVIKDYQLALVAADPRIYSTAEQAVTVAHSTNQSCENQGSAPTPPVFRVSGPSSGTATGPTVSLGGAEIALPGLSLTSGTWVDIDTKNRTVVDNTGASRYSTVDFVGTSWFDLLPSTNLVRLDWDSGTLTSSTLRITWRDAWV